MMRFSLRWAVTAVLGSLVFALTASPARAQFFPAPYPYGGYGYGMGLYNPGTYINPFTGAFRLNTTYPFGVVLDPFNRQLYYPLSLGINVAGVPVAGYLPLASYGYGGYGGGAYYGGPYYGSGPTMYTPNYSNPLVKGLIRELGGYNPGQYGAGNGYGGVNEIEARKALADQRAKLARANADQQAGAGNAKAADPNLMNAREDEILSGKALNDLAAAIRRQESKGAKAESPLLPAGLLAQMSYTGGPAADALMLLQDGKVEYPAPLRADRFEKVRADLDQPIAGVADPLLTGKRVEAPAADRLVEAVQKAKTEVTPATKQMPVSDAAAVNRFFDRLLNLAEFARTPNASGLVVPKWSTIGASVADLVSHLDKYKITFGPAEPGSREAYVAVHRGMAGYYVSLAQAGKK